MKLQIITTYCANVKLMKLWDVLKEYSRKSAHNLLKSISVIKLNTVIIMCLCTTSHHTSSDNINRPTTMSMSMSMSMSPPTRSTPLITNIGSDDGISWDDITIQEDDTCYLLSIDMPNVNGKDVNISLQKNIITISGYRRCARSSSFSSTDTNSSTSSEEQDDEQQQQQRSHHKRQRLVSRRLEIDSNVIDIDRAIANTWNGSLTLYAPKRRPTSSVILSSHQMI
jgi:HSP20 family molecular chaperone IbpA